MDFCATKEIILISKSVTDLKKSFSPKSLKVKRRYILKLVFRPHVLILNNTAL